jgi:hypothetical protein
MVRGISINGRLIMSLKTLVGAGAVGVLVFTAVPAAQAATPTPTPTATQSATPKKQSATPKQQSATPKQLKARAHRLCARVDKVQHRVDRVAGRLSAGADKRGSVKWLQARATVVRAKNPAKAELLDGRARVGQARLATLQVRREQLPKVAKWCDEHGLGGTR